MRLTPPTRLLVRAAAFAALALSAVPAAAQQDDKPRATSDLSAATQTATTPAQQRDARVLATAVFAAPAAKAKAAQKLDDANHPELSAIPTKPEWTEPPGGVGLGGKGVQIKTPF
jgi:outer membrane PBP1 activator LpoA protein